MARGAAQEQVTAAIALEHSERNASAVNDPFAARPRLLIGQAFEARAPAPTAPYQERPMSPRPSRGRSRRVYQPVARFTLVQLDRLEPRVLLAGNVDPTFGVQVTTDFGLRGDVALGVDRQPDGKSVVVGYSRGEANTDRDLALARYNADGTLDTAFGSGATTTIGPVRVTGGGGRVTLSYNDPVELDRGESGQRVAVQSDGKIVVSASIDGMITLVRFNADGSLDTSFDDEGLATMQDRSDGTHTVWESRTDLALLKDGAGNTSGYLLSGTQQIFDPSDLDHEIDQNWVLAKFDVNGRPDVSFGAGGRVVTDFAGAGFAGQTVSWDESFAMKVLPDGKILQSGGNEVLRRTGQFRNAISFVRFNPDGTPDTTFGGTRYFRAFDLSVTSGPGVAGQTTVEFLQKTRETGELDTLWTKPFVTITGMAEGPNGSILATGPELNRTFREAPTKNTSRILVYKLAADGRLDTSFAGDGIYEGLSPAGRQNQQDEPTSILYRPDIDRVVVIGKSGDGEVVRAPGKFLLLQLLPDGTADTSFGPEGAKFFTAGATMGRFNAALLQPDGKLVAVGESGQGIEPINSDFVVGRFNPDGSLDTNFGADNSLVPDMTVMATAVQSDGKILAAGYRGSIAAGNARAVVARFTADGAPDPTFAPVRANVQGTVGTVANAFATNGFVPAVAYAVAEGPDGSVYLTGTVGAQLAVARFTAGGLPDTTFDASDDDPATTDVNESDGVRLVSPGNGAAAGYGITALGDGSPVVVGDKGGDWLVLKLTPAGTLDPAFGGGDGFTTRDLGSGEDTATTPLVLADGHILVAGTTRAGDGRIIQVARFNADGSIDATFAGGTVLSSGLTTGTLGVDDPLNRLDARSVAVDGAGNILVAGASGNDAAVARFNAAGGADGGFGSGGVATFDWGGTDDPDSIIVDDDGQIILTGTVDNAAVTGPVVAVVTPDGSRRTDFGTNGVLFLDASAGAGLGRSFRSGELLQAALGSRQGSNVVVASLEQRGTADQRRRSAIQRVLAPAALATDPNGPDLTVTFTTPVSGSFVGGAKLPGALSIGNAGPGTPNQATAVKLYLSIDTGVDDADRAIGTVTVRKPQKAGKVAKARLNKIFVPTDLAAGTYRVLAKADAENSITETNELNNTADGGTITVAPPFTDAVPVSLSAVKLRNGRGAATLLVRNDGNVALRGAISGTLYASSDATIDAGDTALGTYTAKASIKPGASKRVKVKFALPAGAAGPFTLIATADAPGDPTPGQSAAAAAVQ
jgi:uncharacterized delta-60 repeat protein